MIMYTSSYWFTSTNPWTNLCLKLKNLRIIRSVFIFSKTGGEIVSITPPPSAVDDEVSASHEKQVADLILAQQKEKEEKEAEQMAEENESKKSKEKKLEEQKFKVINNLSPFFLVIISTAYISFSFIPNYYLFIEAFVCFI